MWGLVAKFVGNPMLEIKKITKKYGGQIVLDNLSTIFNEKGITIIVGTNGSGKTTLFNIVVGMQEADSGVVELDGFLQNSREYKECLFYIPSDFYLPEYMTGEEYAEFVLGSYPKSKQKDFEMIVQILGMSENKKYNIESYSFGMKKKLQLSVAIASHAKYILADEIFSGLDFETMIICEEMFRKISRKTSIIVVSHDTNTLSKFPQDIRIMIKGDLTNFSGSNEDLTDFIRNDKDVNEKLTQIIKYLETY